MFWWIIASILRIGEASIFLFLIFFHDFDLLVSLQQEIRKEEEKLAQEQEEKVKENLKKLDEIQACTSEKTIQRLSRYYGLKCESAD